MIHPYCYIPHMYSQNQTCDEVIDMLIRNRAPLVILFIALSANLTKVYLKGTLDDLVTFH